MREIGEADAQCRGFSVTIFENALQDSLDDLDSGEKEEGKEEEE